MRTCRLCLQAKPIEAFQKRARGKDGRHSRCKACVKASTPTKTLEKRRELAKEYRENHGEKCKESGRRWYNRNPKHQVGLTKEEYEDLLDYQEGKCAICSAPPTQQRLALDHSHSTGLLRGLLCAHCNRGLGLFREDESVLASAIAYLRHHANRPQPTVDISDVIEMYLGGFPESDIAIKYGVATPYIHELLVEHRVERRRLTLAGTDD